MSEAYKDVKKKHYTEFYFRPSQNEEMRTFKISSRRNALKTLDCVVCNTYVIYGTDLAMHTSGYKHINNLNEIEKSWIRREISLEKQSLVGLEYLVELINTPEVKMLHVCMLCGFNGKPRDILKHFLSISHKKKFLETHFSSYFRFIPDEAMLITLCDEIERLKGRLKPMVCFYDEFDKNVLKVWKRIESGKHFTEENCLELLHVLKDKWKPKRECDEETSNAKKMKMKDSSESKDSNENDVSAGQLASFMKVDQKVFNFGQCCEYFQTLTQPEIDNIKQSLKLAEEHASKEKIPEEKVSPEKEGSHNVASSSEEKTFQDEKPSMQTNKETEPSVSEASKLLMPQINTSATASDPLPAKDDEHLSENDLSITELNILIDNFETLKTKDRNNLIKFLRKLEVENPEKFKVLH